MKVIILMLMILVSSIGCSNTNGIIVKKFVEGGLDSYKAAYVAVEHDAYTEIKKRQRGPETTFVSSEIRAVLKDLGINPFNYEAESDLKILCLFKHGWGLPRFTIHFHLKAKYITWVNIQLIDKTTKDVIGEVEYHRPWSETNPHDLYKQMFEAMLGRDIEERPLTAK